MLELREGSCYPKVLVGVNVGLACVDGVIAVLAFCQLMRIHARSSHLGWTRQKLIGLVHPEDLILKAITEEGISDE